MPDAARLEVESCAEFEKHDMEVDPDFFFSHAFVHVGENGLAGGIADEVGHLGKKTPGLGECDPGPKSEIEGGAFFYALVNRHLRNRDIVPDFEPSEHIAAADKSVGEKELIAMKIVLEGGQDGGQCQSPVVEFGPKFFGSALPIHIFEGQGKAVAQRIRKAEARLCGRLQVVLLMKGAPALGKQTQPSRLGQGGRIEQAERQDERKGSSL